MQCPYCNRANLKAGCPVEPADGSPPYLDQEAHIAFGEFDGEGYASEGQVPLYTCRDCGTAFALIRYPA